MLREVWLNSAGRYKKVKVSQEWAGDEDFLNATFAGQRMLLITDRGLSSLAYLDYCSSGHSSIAEAKAAAPEFARTVLALMTASVTDAVEPNHSDNAEKRDGA